MKPAIDEISQNSNILNHCGRIGVVANQTSVNSQFVPSTDIIYEAAKFAQGSSVSCVFGPQHGYYQTEQDNMKETQDDIYKFKDGNSVPLFSLYSNTRAPTKQQIDLVDTFIIDLQDIGCRVYTYMLTLAACLRSAAQYNKKVVVLDRINPLGLCNKDTKGNWIFVEGNKLETKWHSFVGWYDIPMRHGLSLGELGYYFIKQDKLKVDYKVVPVKNLTRKLSIAALKTTKWTMPSPNIPCWESAYFFPAFVLLEGTNISEGRGSTIPFQLIGAPWLDSKKCIEFLNNNKETYLYNPKIDNNFAIRQHNFRPTFNKHMGAICNGIQFHIENPDNVNLFALGLSFLYYCITNHRNDFKWTSPGYEYNYKDLPINLILGTDSWTHFFESSSEGSFKTLKSMLFNSQEEAQKFIKSVEDLLIYRE
ncbi:MAG: DUF1343 domain-containing protein [Spirobacillus cienkowskii]|uniref:DUF1343 domain-containing protein n=1 Tax=Spirobacillus cienkowskii TaxID=495820 RepID=A0A369KP01_9BACT|nr:MAG: DUF1343 domain-containing protein [Spirobacillus cienkowskii]